MIKMRDAYDILGEEKMRLADKMASEMKGKTTTESLDVILKYMPAITSGRRFTDEERKVVISKIREFIPLAPSLALQAAETSGIGELSANAENSFSG